MSINPTPTLKRPWSSSQPSSPTSSSSPKRAASEDSHTSELTHSQGSIIKSSLGLLNVSSAMSGNTSIPVGGPGSSPLRKSEADGDETGWVRRTEEVHINSDTGMTEEDTSMDLDEKEWVPHFDQETLKEHYNIILGAMPPPFVPWAKYYIIPAALVRNLQQLALDPHGKDTPPESSLRLDMLPLVDGDGRTIATGRSVPQSDGSFALENHDGSAESFWSMKPNMTEDEDFKFIAAQGWEKIKEWYTPESERDAMPELARFCLPGDRIELNPPVFTIHVTHRPSSTPPSAAGSSSSEVKQQPPRLMLPSEAPTRDLLGSLKHILQKGDFGADDAQASWRIWLINTSATGLASLSDIYVPATVLPSISEKLLWASGSSEDLVLGSLGLADGDSLVVEIARKSPVGGPMWAVSVNEQGKAAELAESTIPVPTAPPPLFSSKPFFPGSGSEATTSRIDTATSFSASGSGAVTRSQSRQGSSRKGKGLVGLVNLGNTCFMNSAVQCLSNTPELNDYFLSGVYRNELNPDNPLGMGGKIADAFGQTVEVLWAPSASHSSYTPRQLKWTTGRFAPQFAGYGQHDTQEFMAFLLDGLHEDLNRIKKKPYIEKPDWKPGGGDKELAELGRECWEGYKKRNDSVIVDLFQGQLKSTLVCPECNKESITLDPFMYLTVPLPVTLTRILKCQFIPLDCDQLPVPVRLSVPSAASFMHVKEKLGELFKCNPKQIVGFDLWKSMVYSWFDDSDPNSEAKDSDFAVFYETAVPVQSTRKATGTATTEATITVPVYTFRTTDASSSRYSQNSYPSECSYPPFFINLTKAEASDPIAVREAITRGYQRVVKEELKSALWVHSGSSKAASALPQMDSIETTRSGDDEELPVTEIHLEGDETRVVEVSSARSEPSVDMDGSVTLSPANTFNGLHGNKSSTSLSDAASVRSGKMVPRGDLFQVHVADAGSSEGQSSFNFLKSKETVVPFYKGNPSSASANWSPLENRKKARKNYLSSITAGIKSVVSYGSEEEPSPPATPTSPPLVVRPGEGIFCEWSWQRHGEFLDSEPPRGELVIDPAIAADIEKKKQGKNISIDDCLDEFSKEETLGQDDLWYCPQCKKHQAATKKLEIYQVPDILVICIKRFGGSVRRSSDKLDNLVNFPVDGLDLSDRIGGRKVSKSLELSPDEAAKYGVHGDDEPLLYDLYAVDNHFGGMGGGHYTAFCRNKEDGKWYNYDDSRVSPANVEAVQSRAAYLLFYRRRTSRPIGGVSHVKVKEASRAASPMPDSPSSGPSTATTSTLPASEMMESTDLDLPPQYPSQLTREDLLGDSVRRLPIDNDSAMSGPGTPEAPSPSFSEPASDSDDDDRYPRQRSQMMDLSTLGASVGFGNTAWGLSSNSGPDTLNEVKHSFGSTINLAHAPPSPPVSDSDFEQVPITAETTGPTEEIMERSDGAGGDFQVVKSRVGANSTDESDDAEMVSAPESL